MDIVNKLNKELLKQDSENIHLYSIELERCKTIAQNYAEIENSISVLSDMHTNSSYIYWGEFSRVLGLNVAVAEDRINSIWEEQVLKCVHPDDLYDKYLQELHFFHFMKRQPKSKRTHYYLMNKLRIKDALGNYISVIHRLFYISDPFNNSMWLALCLYNPMLFEISGSALIVNSLSGEVIELDSQSDSKILSEREKQVLRLIDKGLMSKHIATALSISIHTVSRHRQEILGKLQVKNSIEACRIAKDLGLL